MQLPAQVRGGLAGSWPAEVCDLSTTGARLFTTGPIEATEHVVLTVSVSEEPRHTVYAPGIALRVAQLDPDTSWGRMVAVEFDAPLNETAESSVAWLVPVGL